MTYDELDTTDGQYKDLVERPQVEKEIEKGRTNEEDKVLEIERLIKKTDNFVKKEQLKEESIRLQRQVGLENKRKIAKELGCDIRSIYKFVHKEIK